MQQEPTTTHAAPHHGPTPREYVRIGAILAVLTGAEVWMSYSGLAGALLIFTLFTAAIIKFVLVVAYFMHLKYDDRRYARFFVMGLTGAVTLYLIVLLASKVFLR
ncbi:MAG: cytochrome C oxidase subunit IV family protein [Actinomycetota bacterium]